LLLERLYNDDMNVRNWHESEVSALPADVGYWGKTGKHLVILSITGFD